MATARKRFSSSSEDDYFSFDRSPFIRPASPSPSGRFSLRRSIQSSRSSTVESSVPGSCVACETSKDDCSTHRFIVWAAVKRNACKSMTDDDRRTCPLNRCGLQFGDHESMLRHLVECSYLPSCEYYCHDHEVVERFDDSKCKKCLGHPSRRKKMLHMAKNFFSSLGQKGGKGRDSIYSPAPVSPSQSYIDTASRAELSTSTEIVEIDSAGISYGPEPQDPEPSIDPQALLLPELATASMIGPHATRFPLDSAMAWQPTPIQASYGFGEMAQAGDANQYQNPVPPKPLLQVTTQGLRKCRKVQPAYTMAPPPAPRSKNLSPSSSVRSTTSTMSSISSIISPISAWSHDSNSWNPALDTNTTSPNTDLVSFEDFLPSNTKNFLNAANAYQDPCPPADPQAVFELPADSTYPLVDLSADPSLFSFDTNILPNLSYDSNMVLTEEIGETIDLGPLVNVQPVGTGASASNGGSEVMTLVASTRDMLTEHVASSQSKMQELGTDSRLINELRTLSPQAITTIGLRTLRDMLDLRQPSSPVDAICVVHLVYAISLIEYGQDITARAHQLFVQCLDYSQYFASSERAAYLRLATTIWRPASISDFELSNRITCLSRTPSNSKGKCADANLKPTDRLVCTAQHFLDDLEMSAVLRTATPLPPEIQTSSLYMKHYHHDGEAAPNQGFDAIVELIIRNLRQSFYKTKGLDRKLNAIQEHVTSRAVRSVRRVELELLDAGRTCMISTTFFDKYVPQVRELCDSLYRQHESTQRTAYLKHGVTLMENLMCGKPATAPPTTVAPPDIGNSFDAGFLTNFPNIVCTDAGSLFPNPAIDMSALNLGLDANIQPVDLDDNVFLTEPSTCSSASSASPSFRSSSTTASSISPPSQTPDHPDNSQQQKVESDSCCDICGYRPKGDPQWFKGSMARHKKMKHFTSEKIYLCPFPGCNSRYRNRYDNLQQHMKEKNHWVVGQDGSEGVGEEGVEGKRKKKMRKAALGEEVRGEDDEGEHGGAERRPSKRKKISE